jgi:hypothetical protein
MKSYHFTWAFILLFLISCSPKPTWKTYTSDKGRFKVDFKDEPLVQSKASKFQSINITWISAVVDKPDQYNLSYLVKYADFPSHLITSDSLNLLQEFFLLTQMDLASTLEDSSCDAINFKEIHRYPGREFRWIDQDNKLGYTRRTFLVKNRLYFLEVKYKLERDFNNDIEGFLDSFALLDEEVNANPEIIAEKPEKLFEANFPGKTSIRDNPIFHEFCGSLYAILEAYEVPQEQIMLPSTKNILYGVSYAKFPKEVLDTVSAQALRDVVTKTFADRIEQSNGEFLEQKEITLDKHWGIEGQGTALNGMVVLHIRSYIVDDYYYQVMVMSKNGTQNNKEALDFLNSFKLKPKSN